MPCRLILIRQVAGLKWDVPWPLKCLILNVPRGNATRSVLLPWWSTPPAVTGAPTAMMLALVEVADVFMIWKNSIPPTGVGRLAGRPAADTSAAPGQPVLVRLAGRVRPLMPRAGQGEMPISWMIPWAGDGISVPAVSVATSTGITPCVLVA